MRTPTICPRCGREYQESSEDNAARPDRCCPQCWSAQAKAYVQREPAPAKRASGQCRSCGAQIVWLKTSLGRNMPVDAETWEPGDEIFQAKRHTSHFATCPQAAAHRTRYLRMNRRQ